MAAILHKVKRGETIMSICLTYGLTYDQYLKLHERFGFCDMWEGQSPQAGTYVIIGDSADPLDLVRVLHRKGKL